MTGRLLHGLAEILGGYDHLILDIFGVLHDGLRAFPDTVATLRAIQDQGLQTCLLSNTPRRAHAAVAQMERMGIGRGFYTHIVTSGESAFESLRDDEKTFGKKCWFIGRPSPIEITHDLDLTLLPGPEGADFILNSIPGTEDSDVRVLEKNLRRAADLGLPMLCANPDLVVNIGNEQHLCAGTFAAFYESIGGCVVYHGKPHTPVYERCHALLGHPDKTRILAIGDAFHTDIAGARRFGIASVLNLDGIHGEEVAMDATSGTLDPRKLKALLAAKEHKPDYVIQGFRM